MRTLNIDLETYCELDIRNVGAYAYCSHPSFEIMLFGYAFDNKPVQMIDLMNGDKLPKDIRAILTDTNITKSAFNANFERVSLANHFDREHQFARAVFSGRLPDKYSQYAPPEQWQCSAVKARVLGLPGYLKGAAKALNLENQKDAKGKKLINYFCKPCRPTKKNGGRTRNLPEHAPEEWEQFKDYCKMDVEVERELSNTLAKYPVMDKEWKLWQVDQKINDRGVLADMDLVNNMIAQDDMYKSELMQKGKDIANIENPNSVSQLKTFIGDQLGREIETLNKKNIPSLIEEAKEQGADEVEDIIAIRKKLAKTSVSKYHKIKEVLNPDGRIRGMLMFHGANTGRWAGRLVQLQNLPRNKIKNLDAAREVGKACNYNVIKSLYGSFANTASQLIRTAFIAPEGKKLVVSDFSAIEARVIAWLADETWRMEVFNSHGKIYEASAASMFKVPIDTIAPGKANYHMRARGKIAELALGYQGATGAMKGMGALDMGLKESELQPIVDKWREANPHIVNLWYEIQDMAIKALEKAHRTRKKTVLEYKKGIKFIVVPGWLFIELPNGRRVAYRNAGIGQGKYGKKLVYEHPRYGYIDTYGGKLTENIVQAIARDCLGESMLAVEKELQDYNMIMHIHDEIVSEVPKNVSIDRIYEIMGRELEWAKGLPLGADGFETQYYKKD